MLIARLGGDVRLRAAAVLAAIAAALVWGGSGSTLPRADDAGAASSGAPAPSHVSRPPPSGATLDDASRRLRLSIDDLLEQQRLVASLAKRLGALLPTGRPGQNSASKSVTIAVGVGIDAQGKPQVVVASSDDRGYLIPKINEEIRAIVARGTPVEVARDKLGGLHAEDRLDRFMERNALTRAVIGASKPICNVCAQRAWRSGAVFATPLKRPLGAFFKDATNVVFSFDGADGGLAGLHQSAVGLLRILATSQRRPDGASTSLLALPFGGRPPPPEASGLLPLVGHLLSGDDQGVEAAAQELVRRTHARRRSSRGQKVALVARGLECLVVKRAAEIARAKYPGVGLAVDVITLIDSPNLGVDFVSMLSVDAKIVLVKLEGGVWEGIGPGVATYSAAWNDTGQVSYAAGGSSISSEEAYAVAARAASGKQRRPARGRPADTTATPKPAPASATGPAPAPTPAPALAPGGEAPLSNAVGAAQAPAASNLGGIDFSSLELRYVADASSQGTRASAFAFKAVAGKSRGRRATIARQAVRESSDAFFVWLALPAQSFTVNLNPSEPGRIVDSELGRTDAGRILLEADLRMKKTVARLIHPERRLGARFWNALDRIYESQSARVCLSFRQWIVPAPATVSETRGELYILKAPLNVKMESEYRRRRPVAGGDAPSCPGQPQALEERSEALYRRMILPHVQRAVRRRPEYAALRRVYLSRVAAEWYRRLGAREGGAFVEIIDSGDVSRWVSRRRWRPRDVFDRYVRSFTRGEFHVKRRTRQGNVVKTTTLVYGGVDFTSVPQRAVSVGELRRLRPGLPAMLARALSRPVADRDRGEIWLAGASFDRTFGATDPLSTDGSSLSAAKIIGGALLLLAIGAAGAVHLRRMRA